MKKKFDALDMEEFGRTARTLERARIKRLIKKTKNLAYWDIDWLLKEIDK